MKKNVSKLKNSGLRNPKFLAIDFYFPPFFNMGGKSCSQWVRFFVYVPIAEIDNQGHFVSEIFSPTKSKVTVEIDWNSNILKN